MTPMLLAFICIERNLSWGGGKLAESNPLHVCVCVHVQAYMCFIPLFRGAVEDYLLRKQEGARTQSVCLFVFERACVQERVGQPRRDNFTSRRRHRSGCVQTGSHCKQLIRKGAAGRQEVMDERRVQAKKMCRLSPST